MNCHFRIVESGVLLRLAHLIATTFLCTLFAAHTLLGQSGVIRIPDGAQCPTCELIAQPVVRLGAPEGPGSLSGFARAILQDRTGRYWIACEDDIPRVFDANGKFLRAVGRKGKGPGEYIDISALTLLPGDSVLIFDVQNQRASIVSPAFEFVRSVTLPAGRVMEAVSLDWPHRVLVNALYRSPSQVGLPLHIMDYATNVASFRASFGSKGDLRPGQSAELLRALTSPRSGHVWAADLVRYHLTSFDHEGRIRQTIARDAEWFPGVTNFFSIGTHDKPPPPKVRVIAEDDRARVWVFAHVAAANWRTAWVGIPRNPPGKVVHDAKFPQPPIGKLLRTRVEILSPDLRRVWATGFYNGFVVASLRDGKIAAWSESPEGIPYVHILQVVVRR
ncbi:MAG: 6-bladed beta-propeller [Longimicrobiales bacterium]